MSVEMNNLYNLTEVLPKTIECILIFIAILLINKIVQRVLGKVKTQFLAHEVVLLLHQIIKIAIWVVGLLTILATVGIDIFPLIASLGLTGFAVGLACKDLLENLIAGIMILLYRPFKIGDSISASGNSGIVTNIHYRYTEIQSDKERFLLPNALLLKGTVSILNKEN